MMYLEVELLHPVKTKRSTKISSGPTLYDIIKILL